MHARTLAILCALLLALGGLAWWRTQAPVAPAAETLVPLFAALETTRVVALRVDHRERSTQVLLERDEAGRWQMADPIRAPADEGIVAVLLEIARGARGEVVTGAALAGLGLDPPRAELTFVERVGEEERRHRVRLGALDLDGARVHVERDGQVLRIARTLDTALARSANDYRSRRILSFDPSLAVRFARARPDRPGTPVDDGAWTEPFAGFTAERAGATLATREPLVVRLDPLAAASLLRSMSALEALHFVDDQGTQAQRFGLDQPEFACEVELATGEVESVQFARPAADRAVALESSMDAPDVEYWYCQRPGRPEIYEVVPSTVRMLALPLALIADDRVHRVPREQIDWIALRHEGGGFRIEREGVIWRVGAPAPRSSGSGAPVEGAALDTGASWPADTGEVEDLLGLLERAQLEWRPAGEPFGEVAATLEIGASDGEVYAAEIGPVPAAADGTGGERRFRRAGEGPVGLLPAELGAELGIGALDLCARIAHEVPEFELAAIRFQRGERELRYVADARSIWTREGSPREEREFSERFVDRLRRLSVTRWLDAGAGELADRLDVELVLRSKPPIAFALGLAEGGAVEFRDAARRAELPRALYDELIALLSSE